MQALANITNMFYSDDKYMSKTKDIYNSEETEVQQFKSQSQTFV